MKSFIKWTAGLVVIVAIGLAGTFFAVGGRQGAILLYVKHALRKEAAPNQAIAWAKPGPAANQQGADRKPNIIVILADDLGFNDITFYGGGVAKGSVPTPNIDSIAREGVNFPSGYAGNATCSPSRAAMMTGRYPTRFGFEFTAVPVSFARVIGGHAARDAIHKVVYHAELEKEGPAYEKMAVPTSEVTIAKLLKSQDYRSIHIGKWHLGDSDEFQPRAHSFDESLTFPGGALMFMEENDPRVVNSKQDFDPIDLFLWAAHPFNIRFNDSKPFKPGGYMTDYLTDEAIKAIEANKDRPFFMYLAYNAPHTPLQATREDYDALAHIQDHTLRVYAAMIRSLDRNIGRVLAQLKAQGIDDNTLVVFTSDNGGAHYIGLDDLNKPYRGWKATFFEGGVRVPYFMRWPGMIQPGSTFQSPVSHFDIFATAAGAAGVSIPQDRTIDGVDLLPFIMGKAEGRPHDRLFWRSGAYRVVQAGDWKLQSTERPRLDRLFNIKEDPTEQNDVAAAEPAKVTELRAMLAAFDKEQAKPIWPSLVEAPILIDKPMNRPQQPNDDYIYWAN